MNFINSLISIFKISGFTGFTLENLIMMLVAAILLYFAIVKKYEPLLLLPIAFGAVLVNLPFTGLMEEGGFLQILSFGIHHELFPILIFMGIGAMTDFGPLLANPATFLLGAAAQLGVSVALIGAVLIGFSLQEAAAIAIIGGADGPTSIYLASKLSPHILGAIAVAAYSYMSLVPLIQPPIMKLCTTREHRKIV
ncbi:MAG: sodium ion-translocating decarboxylase subunit beta, partial [Eubacteriales bacterium]|nr:sodium ion-translocating decarboxylase subunit beta [Eubacteriales bacterium]